MLVDSEKKLTPTMPFYAVDRLEGGTVVGCAKGDLPCDKCIFAKFCMLLSPDKAKKNINAN